MFEKIICYFYVKSCVCFACIISHCCVKLIFTNVSIKTVIKKNENLPNEGLAHFPICAAHNKPNRNESFFYKKYSEKTICLKTEFKNMFQDFKSIKIYSGSRLFFFNRSSKSSNTYTNGTDRGSKRFKFEKKKKQNSMRLVYLIFTSTY